MKQMTFADAEYAGKRKQTRKELFLSEMDRVVPWKGLIALIEPHYPKGEGGRPAYPLMAMLRVIPVSRSVPSMQAAKWFGRWQPGAAPTKSWARAARCTNPDARSRKPRLRYGPRSSTRSGAQAPVRLREYALPWLGQEHCTTGDAVRAVEPVDGAPTFADQCRRGASVMWEMAAATCSQRLKKTDMDGGLTIFDRFATFKIGGG